METGKCYKFRAFSPSWGPPSKGQYQEARGLPVDGVGALGLCQ
jgi:hypothetical protein